MCELVRLYRQGSDVLPRLVAPILINVSTESDLVTYVPFKADLGLPASGILDDSVRYAQGNTFGNVPTPQAAGSEEAGVEAEGGQPLFELAIERGIMHLGREVRENSSRWYLHHDEHFLEAQDHTSTERTGSASDTGLFRSLIVVESHPPSQEEVQSSEEQLEHAPRFVAAQESAPLAIAVPVGLGPHQEDSYELVREEEIAEFDSFHIVPAKTALLGKSDVEHGDHVFEGRVGTRWSDPMVEQGLNVALQQWLLLRSAEAEGASETLFYNLHDAVLARGIGAGEAMEEGNGIAYMVCDGCSAVTELGSGSFFREIGGKCPRGGRNWLDAFALTEFGPLLEIASVTVGSRGCTVPAIESKHSRSTRPHLAFCFELDLSAHIDVAFSASSQLLIASLISFTCVAYS